MLGKQNRRKHRGDNGILSLRKSCLIIGEIPLISMEGEALDFFFFFIRWNTLLLNKAAKREEFCYSPSHSLKHCPVFTLA